MIRLRPMPTISEAQGQDLPKLIGDNRRFQQILINLVKNALKFTKRGTIVMTASYNELQENLVVKVQDSGVGISAEDIP